MTLSRRSLITGLISLVAAPAIVRVSSLMPVKAMEPAMISGGWVGYDGTFNCPAEIYDLLRKRVAYAESIMRNYIIENMEHHLYHSTGVGSLLDSFGDDT